MRIRATALVLVLSLAATACGSRLTEEQRTAALQQFGAAPGEAAPATDGPAGPADDVRAADTVPSTDANSDADDAASGDGAVGSAGSAEPQGPTAAPADDAAPAQPAEEQDGGGGGQQPVDTRAMPEGGNGGATDVGVTEDTIVLGNVSDVSGPVPGIFEPSQLAVKAYLAYFRAREGTIYGRQLEYLPKDGRLDTGANRSASIELCENAFMGVGSMSAMDQGAAPVIDDCDIPDLRASANTTQMEAVDNAHPTSASTSGVEPLGEYEWFASEFPDSVTRAAFIMICGEVTEQATGALMAAQEAQLGYEYVYTQCIEIQETNYAPFVANMKDAGVDYVAFQGAYQQAVRLAEAMRQQDFWPTVYVLQSNIYNQNFLQLGGSAVNDSYVVTSSALVEEFESNPELKLYVQWLEQVAPGERPTGLGMYSWSAAKLAVQLLKDIGPNVTRAKMLEAMRQVDDWTGGGLHGPQDVAGQHPDNCFNILQVQDQAFARVHPGGGQMLDCSSTAYADTR